MGAVVEVAEVHPDTKDLPSKKRVWGFRTPARQRIRKSAAQVAETRRKNAPTPMKTVPGISQFLLTDQVGTLRAVADTTGAIVKRIDYDSFGNIIADSNPSFTVPFGFAGGLHDRDTGLVRFGYRDYSPELGRFVAKDPIDFAGGDTNLYAYVMNDPINLTDPEGLSALDWLVVPGPYGQPRSEWGPNGPTEWGNPFKYTEHAGGGWKWAERVSYGAAVCATGVAVGVASVESTTAFRIPIHGTHGGRVWPHLQGIQGPGWGVTKWRFPPHSWKWPPF